jgi:phosphopentomutase
MNRAVIIVMDSTGIGEMPDSWEYGDQGSNTLGNISREMGGLRLPICSVWVWPILRPSLS